jgi:hypothetical protein
MCPYLPHLVQFNFCCTHAFANWPNCTLRRASSVCLCLPWPILSIQLGWLFAYLLETPVWIEKHRRLHVFHNPLYHVPATYRTVIQPLSLCIWLISVYPPTFWKASQTPRTPKCSVTVGMYNRLATVGIGAPAPTLAPIPVAPALRTHLLGFT